MSGIRIKNKHLYTGPGEYIGRPSPLGNPFKLIGAGGIYTRESSIVEYRGWLKRQMKDAKSPEMKELQRLADLYTAAGSLTLICWCKPLTCHGDVIKETIETFVTRRQSK